jgi:hypothetical protein
MVVLRILLQRRLSAVAAGALLTSDERGGRNLRRVSEGVVGCASRKMKCDLTREYQCYNGEGSKP